jgi:hypothetical protein
MSRECATAKDPGTVQASFPITTPEWTCNLSLFNNVHTLEDKENFPCDTQDLPSIILFHSIIMYRNRYMV